MKMFHVNTGQIFAQPYESEYAIIRRCLVANPGIPFTAIGSSLRMMDSKTELIADRLQNLQPSLPRTQPFKGLKFTYRRQCPKCAALLYHTDLYIFEWLTHCPIHHIALTKVCPCCHLPWPDRGAIAKRDCPTCGRLSFKQLCNFVIPGIQSMDYTPIERIYSFIRHQKNTQNIRLDCFNPRTPFYDYVSPWWRFIKVDSLLFPGGQLPHCKGYIGAELDALHIKYRPMQYKSSPLYACKKSHIDDIRRWQIDTNNLTCIYQAMKIIIHWIVRHTPGNHVLHISEYFYLDLQYAINKTNFCPYCTALSLWFFDVLGPYLDPYFRERRLLHKFLLESGFGEFYRKDEPYLIVDDKNYYVMNKAFSTWFYQRGLIISYMDIQQYIFQLDSEIRRSLSKGTGSSNINYRINRELFTDQFCSFDIVNGRFKFYYANEQPLNDYIPIKIPNLGARCKAYHHRYSNFFIENKANVNVELSASNFSVGIFRSLTQEYRNHMEGLLK
ncbi:MAG: hypothetical protein OQL06_00840 [Gammaproteobacteria bacterium]|nr:hypothetical protein [Gammaproteobacteria bacterium]